MKPGNADRMLAQRLAVVQEVLQIDAPRATEEGVSLFDTLVSLVEAVRDQRDTGYAWLLLVGLTGAMPGPALVRSVLRALSLREAEDSIVWLLDAAAPLAMQDGNASMRLRVVTDHPVVDVDLTAGSNFLTGIQRVVRGVVSQWDRVHDVELVATTNRGGAYRGLNNVERARLLDEPVGAFDGNAVAKSGDGEGGEIVVPWGVPVVLTEVPGSAMSDRLAAAAELTTCSLRLVGYDCIPVASAEMVPLAEPEKFGRYLELVKFADRVAGISDTAAQEFAGFAAALAAQGLPGPKIVACPLPHDVPILGRKDSPPPTRPLVVCVGTIGRRKNQVALVEACEVLWREGLEFELRLLGHVGVEVSPLTALVPELQSLGRPLQIESGVSDARIAGTLAHARCLAFPTLHEGFGLPVAEALSHGVPVITSDFGSTREIAEGQGGLLVDPEDVFALAGALRSLLTDDVLYNRLVAEASARPVRTWSEYSTELWEALIG